jgi:hypothetical protein
MEPVRRFLSILLLAFFGLPFMSLLFALGTDLQSSAPACCRRNGAHHCLGNTTERAGASKQAIEISAPARKCPYSPKAVAATHPNLLAPGTSAAVFAGIVSHPTGIAQTESNRRISWDRSRQKRGPPSLLSL